MSLLWVLLASVLSVAVPACPDGMLGVPGGLLEAAEGAVPVEAVPVEAFCLARTEVTVEAYGACVRAGVCTPPHDTVDLPNISERERTLWSRSCNGLDPTRVRHPVNCVGQRQAAAYCAWRGGRLPTDAEWTWAARGGDEARTYPWGAAPASERRTNACGVECRERFLGLGAAWRMMYYGDDHHPTTAPAGEKKRGAGRFGHLDLAGNVWEWVLDAFAGDPSVGTIRGGGWAQTDAKWLRSDARAGYPRSSRGSAVGFRCAAEALRP